MKGSNLQPGILFPARLSSRFDGEIKGFTDKQKLREFSITRLALAPHSRTLAWKIPWMEEPGRLQSMGSLRVGQDWATSLSLSFSCIGEGNVNPLQCSCLENPRDGGAWWAAVYGVAQSRTRLKWLSRLALQQMLKKLLEEKKITTRNKIMKGKAH